MQKSANLKCDCTARLSVILPVDVLGHFKLLQLEAIVLQIEWLRSAAQVCHRYNSSPILQFRTLVHPCSSTAPITCGAPQLRGALRKTASSCGCASWRTCSGALLKKLRTLRGHRLRAQQDVVGLQRMWVPRISEAYIQGRAGGGLSAYLQAVHPHKPSGSLHFWAGHYSTLQHILGTCQDTRAECGFSGRLVKLLLGYIVFSRRLAFAMQQPCREAVSA